MSWELDEERSRLREGATEFARAELDAAPDAGGHEAPFDRDAWRKCADFGLMAMPVPVEEGGLGLGLVDLIAVMEGLGYGSRDNGLLFSISAHMWTNIAPLLEFGSEEQKRRYLGGLCDGTLIGGNGASEADAGSDVYSMRTRAEKKGDGYVLNGTKMFVTNAQVADVFVLYATIDPALGPMGVTAFLVERDTPGLEVGRPMVKMGLRSSPMAELVLEDCIVPAGARLGREGRGIAVFESSMEWERGCILATCLGSMRRELESCVRHAQQRKQFGQPLGKFQAVSHRIADMKMRLDASRLLVYRVGKLKDAGQPARLEAAIAKLHVSEACVASALDAMRIFGGYGYMVEQGIERQLRDALGGLFYSGTSDIQRSIIARGLGL